MHSLFHPQLPKAVLIEAQFLPTLEEEALARLLQECVGWQIAIDRLGERSTSEIWRLLVGIEIDMVVAAQDRITTELQSRYEDDAKIIGLRGDLKSRGVVRDLQTARRRPE